MVESVPDMFWQFHVVLECLCFLLSGCRLEYECCSGALVVMPIVGVVRPGSGRTAPASDPPFMREGFVGVSTTCVGHCLVELPVYGGGSCLS